MLFDIGCEKLGIEGRIVSDQRVITAKFRKGGKETFDEGLALDHVVGNPVHHGGRGGNWSARIHKGHEHIFDLAIHKANSADFNDLVDSRNDPGRFKVKGYESHGVRDTEGQGVFQMKPIRFRANGRDVSASHGENLLEALRQAGIPISFSCEGGSCGTCRVLIRESDQLPPTKGQEIETVIDRGFQPDERLACQLEVIEGLELFTPEFKD